MSAPLKQREVLQPSRLKARRRKARIIKGVFFFVLFVLFVGGAVGMFYIPALRVRDVSVLDTKTIDAKEVEQTLRSVLAGRTLFVLPSDNAFLFSEEELQSRVLQTFPKVRKIDITLTNFHTIETRIEERTAYALWCGENKDEPVPCMYMDDRGVVYELSPEYSGNAYTKWYGEVIGERQGGVYLGDTASSLFPLVAEFQKDGVLAHKVIAEKNGDVRVQSDDGFELLFTVRQKPESLLSALRTAKASDALKGKNFSDLQYLDMRFSESRLYYKFK